MKILITGAKGKVGSELSNLFLKKTNHDLIITTRKKRIKNKNKRIFSYHQDLLKPFTQKIDADLIIHLATKNWLTKIIKNEKKEVFDENIKTTKNIQKFANDNKIKKIFFFSTTMVKNHSKKEIVTEKDINRIDLYSKSKLLSEKILCNKKNYFKTTCLRLPGVLSQKGLKTPVSQSGKKEILMRFISLMKLNKNIKIFNPYKKFNNVVDVQEIFEFINKNIKKKNKSVVVQMSASKPIEFIKVITTLKTELKSSSKISVINKEISSFIISNQKIKKIFGFIPSSTENILKRFCKKIYN